MLAETSPARLLEGSTVRKRWPCTAELYRQLLEYEEQKLDASLKNRQNNCPTYGRHQINKSNTKNKNRHELVHLPKINIKKETKDVRAFKPKHISASTQKANRERKKAIAQNNWNEAHETEIYIKEATEIYQKTLLNILEYGQHIVKFIHIKHVSFFMWLVTHVDFFFFGSTTLKSFFPIFCRDVKKTADVNFNRLTIDTFYNHVNLYHTITIMFNVIYVLSTVFYIYLDLLNLP